MIANPPCLNCEHYAGRARCTAYPEGIPGDIIAKGAEHDAPRGDEVESIVFLLNPERATQDAARRKLAGLLAAP